MKPLRIEFLPQRHEEPGADASKVDYEVLRSQVKIARHLLKNKDALIFAEGNMSNLPRILSPAYYRACNKDRFDPVDCRYPSLWRSIKGAHSYFSKFDVQKDLMGLGGGLLLRDRVFATNIVAMGAPAFLFFLGLVRYVIFSDSSTHVERVSEEYKKLDRLFGSFSTCFLAAPRSRLFSIMYSEREKHVLGVIDRVSARAPQKKRILVFGGLHDFTRYNGSKYHFVIPMHFVSEAAHAQRVKKELAASCTDLVADTIVQGFKTLIGSVWKVIKSCF